MKKQLIYKCNITKYCIEFIVDSDDNSALINTIICDHIQMRAFLALLKNSIDKLNEIGIKKIRQCIYFNEWEQFLKNKTSWKIINFDKNLQIYDLECEIDDFLQNYGIGIGL